MDSTNVTQGHTDRSLWTTISCGCRRTGTGTRGATQCPESAQQASISDEFQKSIILTPRPPVPATSGPAAALTPVQKADCGHHGNVPRHTAVRQPSKLLCKSCVCQLRPRPTASPQAQNVHHSSAKCHRSATTVKRLPLACPLCQDGRTSCRPHRSLAVARYCALLARFSIFAALARRSATLARRRAESD